MKHLKKISAALLAAALCLSSAACGQTGTATTADSAAQSAVSLSAPSVEEMLSDRDYEIGYSDYCTVTLADGASTADADGVTIDGDTITITAAGTYLLTGTLSDGQLIVDAGDAKIQLVLSDASVACSGSAALYCRSADKVFVTTADGTENELISTGEFTAIDDSNIDGAIYAKCDLTMNGAGTLTVRSECGHGIVSKDDLAVTSGSYVIDVAKQGLSGKDSVRIAGGTFTITSGTDGIHSENDDADKGFVFISGGTITITSTHDGIDATGAVTIEGGELTLTAGGGSASATKSHADFGPRPGEQQAETDGTDSDYKGIKSDTSILISGGTLTVDASDDAIHTDGTLAMTGGTLTLSTGDDGIHADDALSISGGTVTIAQCYEGIESAVVDISGGDIDITASDDGINAADGTSTGMMQANDNCSLTISGGTITISAEGDGVDSNGDLTVTGGTLLIDGPSNGGNGALDYDGTGTITGGTVIALDQPGMAMNFGASSTQATALVTLDSQQAAGSTVTLTDADGSVLLTYTARKAFQSVLVSCADMAVGSTYTLAAGEETQTIELTETVYGAGSGMGGMPGQMGSEMPAQGERPDRVEHTDDDHTPPDFDNSIDRPEPPADGQFPGNDTNSADTSA